MNESVVNTEKRVFNMCPIGWANGTVTARISRPIASKGGDINPDKLYRPSKRLKRIVESKAAAMTYGAVACTMITLTCLDYIETNEAVTKFLENCMKQKLFMKYLWVRERQERGANHWHLLVTLPARYVDIKAIRRAWASARKSCGFDSSLNSVQVGFKSKDGKKQLFCNDVKRAALYVGKYISKFKKIVLRVNKAIKNGVWIDDIREGEIIKISASSVIKYKGRIELESCFKNAPTKKHMIQGANNIIFLFDQSKNFMRWLVGSWSMHEYINELYCQNFKEYYANS